MEAWEREQCAYEFAPGVRCQMVAGHDEPYYPYLDYGQSGWYSDVLAAGTRHRVESDAMTVPLREEWTGDERKGTVEGWPRFRPGAESPDQDHTDGSE